MDENTKKIVTIVGALIMIGSMFWGVQYFQNNPSPISLTNTTSGTAEFNGTIRTYEPFLVVSGIPDPVLTSLRSDERVKSVNGGASQDYVVNVTSREDVYSLAEDLRKEGISSTAIANIILPAKIDVRYANGSIETVEGMGTIGIWTEPFVDIDTEVTVRMVAVTSAGYLVSYSSPMIASENIVVQVNATIVSFSGKEYLFIIPWQNRSSLNVESLYEEYGNASVDYSRNDIISFQPSLSVSEITAKKSLSYINYISDTGASLSSDFIDQEIIISDFNTTTVIFPDSMLRVVTNKSVDLPYSGNATYTYMIALPNEGTYDFGKGALRIYLSGEYSVNESISVMVNATAIGTKIVKINGIEPD